MIVIKWCVFIWRLLKSFLGILKSPYKMTYVVTKSCYSRCLNCSIWKVDVQNELTLNEVKDIAQAARSLSWIDFTGGEPTNRQDFYEVVEAFIERVPYLLMIHFPTNGMNPGRIQALVQKIRARFVGKVVITVSLDGPPEVHAHLRGIPKGFDLAMETYTRLKQIKGVEVFFGMTIFEENHDQIEATMAAIKRCIPDFTRQSFHLNLGHNSSHYYENQEQKLWSKEKIQTAFEDFQRQGGVPLSPFSVIEKLYLKGVRKYLRTGRSPVPCQSLTASVFLNEKGEVMPCSIWDKTLGNVRKLGLDGILTSTERRTVQSEIRKLNCPNCWTPCEAYQSILAHPVKALL